MEVSNRDFLRSYRHWKHELLRGEVKELNIPQKPGVFLKVTLHREQKKHALDHFMEAIKKSNFKGIKRPEEDII